MQALTSVASQNAHCSGEVESARALEDARRRHDQREERKELGQALPGVAAVKPLPSVANPCHP
jgi:hypothetical protein